MGRPSRLTDRQWENIQKALLDGQSMSAMAKKYGVSKSVISARFSGRLETVKTVAHHIVQADAMFAQLTGSEQKAVNTLVDDMKAVSMHLAGAAKYGAATAHRLAGIANAQANFIDDADPLKSVEAINTISGLTKVANQASEIGVNLLAANKDRLKDLEKREIRKAEIENSVDSNDAAQQYADMIRG